MAHGKEEAAVKHALFTWSETKANESLRSHVWCVVSMRKGPCTPGKCNGGTRPDMVLQNPSDGLKWIR